MVRDVGGNIEGGGGGKREGEREGEREREREKEGGKDGAWRRFGREGLGGSCGRKKGR